MTHHDRRGREVSGQATIGAPRLLLRPARGSDAALYALYAGDRRVAEATRSIPHPLPSGSAEAFVARIAAGAGEETVWIIDGSAACLPEMLGAITLTPMDRGQSEVSFWVAPAFWNLGLASEALSALIAANPFGDKTFFAEAFQDNPGSARVLTNNGFVYIGDAEGFCLARGTRVPTWTYVRRLG